MTQLFVAEFIGTMILIILGDGVVGGVVLQKTKSHNAGWIVITLGWGLAVMMAIYTVGKWSGAHLNPVVTVALAIIGAFDWDKVPIYCIAQFLGAFVGAIVVYLQYLPHWAVTKDKEAKLAVFCNSPAIPHIGANFLSEFVGTFILLFCLLGIGANEFSKGLNPMVVGFLITSIGLSLGSTTGYAINPARDLSPRIAHFLLPIPDKGNSGWNYAWIPVVAPFAGGIAGALAYKFLLG